MRLINARAVKSGGKARLILRLSHGSQFGMDASVIKEVIRNQDSYKGLEIVGLHYFTGTQKTKVQTYAGSFHCWTNSARSWNRSWVSVQSILSVVTGLAVEYFKDFTEETDMALLAEAAEARPGVRRKIPADR